MAEILGLTVTDFPFVRLKPQNMPGVILGNIDRGWADKPHLKDPKNWPKPMQDAWGADRGLTAARGAQARQVEQFRKLRAALDDFKPDFMVFMHRDMGETWRNFAKPPYWIMAFDKVPIKAYTVLGRKDNFFDEDPDKVDTVPCFREGALYLVKKLQEQGLNPLFSLEPYHQNGLGHNCIATLVHLHWDQREFKTPIVPFGVDPFAFLRSRTGEGMSPWIKDNPRPLTPKEAFSLGRAIARAYRPSPWRVALVAGVDWSHANDSSTEFGRTHPDVEADIKRFEEWTANKFTTWGDSWTFEEMEQHAQWELLVTITLAGAMTELGAKVKYADFQANWLFNDDFITTIFEVK
jgi:hypothetical protein